MPLRIAFDADHEPDRQPRRDVGDAFRRSLDLADLAERLLLAAGALTAAAGTFTEAHAANEQPIAIAFDDARRAAGDVFAAIAEFTCNAVLRDARDEAEAYATAHALTHGA